MSGKGREGRETRLDDGFDGRVECRTYPGGILDIIHRVFAICARGCVLVAHSTSYVARYVTLRNFPTYLQGF